MSVNINNLVISQLSKNPINLSKVGNINENMFANLLKNASENQLSFLGENTNLLDIDLEEFTEDCNVNLVENSNIGFKEASEEVRKETEKHISYENLDLGNIFFFGSNHVVNKNLARESLTLISDYNNQLPPKSVEHLNDLKEKPEALQVQETAQEFLNEIQANANLRSTVGNEKPIIVDQMDQKSHIYMEKSKDEYEHVEVSTFTAPLVENKTITISDESTEIKSQVLNQVKDKIIMTDSIEDTNGVKTITMELRPQSLGKVDIKMVYENNKLTVEIKAQNEETQKILSSNTSELRNLLNKSSDLDVKVLVKPNLDLSHQPIHKYHGEQGYEQNLYQDNDQNHQGRQRNKYYYNNLKQSEEDVFSELIDFNYSKMREGGYGN